MPVLSALSACDDSPRIPSTRLPAPGDAAPAGRQTWLTAHREAFRQQLVDGNAGPRAKAIAANGFYAPNLNRDWSPKAEQVATLVTQTRAIYVMAAAFEVTGEARFKDAMLRASAFLLERFKHPRVPGYFLERVGSDGRGLSDGMHLYGHTQAVFALAHAYRSSGDERFLKAALGTWLAIGIRQLIGKIPDQSLSGLNVAMHAFESLMALNRAAPSTLIQADLAALGNTILDRFYVEGKGYFGEHVDKDWRVAPGSEIRVGHNFEMAFLFSRAAAMGMPERFLSAGLAVVRQMAQVGVDPRGAVPHELHLNFAPRDPQIPFWGQMETMRSLAHYSVARGLDELRPVFERVLAFSKQNFLDPVHGGWYRAPNAVVDGKGSDWFAGYHEAMMQTEILRLCGHRFTSGPEMLL